MPKEPTLNALQQKLAPYLEILKQANLDRASEPNNSNKFQSIMESLISIADIYEDEAGDKLTELLMSGIKLEVDNDSKKLISDYISKAVKFCNAALAINRKYLRKKSPDKYEENKRNLVNRLKDYENFFATHVLQIKQKEGEEKKKIETETLTASSSIVIRNEKGILASKTTLKKIRKKAEEAIKELDKWIEKEFPAIIELNKRIKKIEEEIESRNEQEETKKLDNLSDEEELSLAIKMSLETEEKKETKEEKKEIQEDSPNKQDTSEKEQFSLETLTSQKKHLEKEFYKERAARVKSISDKINQDLKGYLKVLLEESIKLLGNPPCGYSILNFGSLAKNSASPYSDIEMAVLIADKDNQGNKYSKEQLEKHRQYFRDLTHILNFKIMALGETTIPVSEIGTNINDITGFAFQFDLGGKTPFGRLYPERRKEDDKEIPGYELIRTPEEMAKLIEDQYFKLDKFLPIEMGVFAHLYGDESIYREHDSRVREYLELEKDSLIFKQAERASIKLNNDDSKKRKIVDSSPSNEVPQKYQLRIKRLLAHININEDLNEENKLPKKYQSRAKQLLIDGYEGGYQDGQGFVHADIDKFGLSLMEKSLGGKLYDLKQEVYRLPDILIERYALYHGVKPTDLFKMIDNLEEKGVIDEECQQDLKIMSAIAIELRLRGYLKHKGQKDRMDILTLRSEQKKNLQQPEIENIFYLPELDKGEDGVLFKFYQISIPFELSLRESFKEERHEKLMIVSLFESEVNVNVLHRLMQYEKSIKYHEKSLKFLEKILSSDPDSGNKYYYSKYVSDLNSLGVTYDKLGNYQEALEYLEKSREMREKIFDHDPHNVANTLYNLGVVYGKLGEHKKKIDLLDEARKIRKKYFIMIIPNLPILYKI